VKGGSLDRTGAGFLKRPGTASSLWGIAGRYRTSAASATDPAARCHRALLRAALLPLTQLWARDDVLGQMRRVMAATISALLIALLGYPALVRAEGLGRPFVLPRVLGLEEEQRSVFAINDAGQAVVAYPSFRDGMPVVIVARLRRSGRLKDPQIVSLPAKSVGAEGTEAGATPLDIALSNNDQVALIDANYDACCDSVGVSSWRLGTSPPALAEVSPQNTEMKVIKTPQVAIDDTGHVFAAWATENQETFRVQVARARNGRYETQTLYTSARLFGIEQFGIQQTGSGAPVLNWVDGLPPTYAFAAAAGRNGEWGAVYRGAVSYFSPVNLGIYTGFATDTTGNQALIYERGQKQLWMVRRAPGHAFGDPQQISGLPEEVAIAAGGGETLLVAWAPHRQNAVIVEIGKTLGRLGSQQRFAVTTPEDIFAAVDDRGRSILVWDAQYRGAHGRSRSGIWFTTAGGNGRFGQPVMVSNPHQSCGEFGGGNPPIVQSPNGHDLISWTCGPNEHQTRYMARYTP
jgi:hypothetical protein